MEEVQEKIVSLEEIILQTENSLKKEEDPRAEITRLKSLFYRTKEGLMAESKKQWIEAGNEEDIKTYLAAEINILSWKLITNDIDL